MKYTNRPICREDFLVIAGFPLNPEELFFMYPSSVYPLTSDQLEDAANNRLKPTVILFDNEVIGYSNLYDSEEGSHCWIGNVIIAPPFRSKGAGTYLINTMMGIAKKQLELKKMKLVCHNINTKALLFYHMLGFKPFDMKTIYDKNGNQIVGIKMEIYL